MDLLIRPRYQKPYDHAVSVLIEHYYFYASLLSRCTVIWTPKNTATAGVRVMPRGKIELLINPEFFLNQSNEERPGLLMHEMLHLLMRHIERSRSIKNAQKANLGMDVEINQLIPEDWLPQGACLPDNMAVPLPRKEIWEVYYNLLPDPPEKPKDKGKGKGQPGQGKDPMDGPMDDHDLWDTGSMDEEEVRQAIEQAVERAIEDTEKNRGAGQVPLQARELMEAARKRQQVPWEQLFMSYIGRKITFNKSYTRKRPSRRLGLLSAGKQKAQGPQILFLTDVSGSVTDREYERVMNEAIHATRQFPDKVSMAFFDWEVFKDEVKLGDQKTLPRRPGKGGTNFEAAFKYAAERKPDLLIMLTDGECGAPKTDPGCPVMWVITGQDNPELQGLRILLPADDAQKATIK